MPAVPFHAHEALEAMWKCSPANERDLWQGLAQLAVGATHAARGNELAPWRCCAVESTGSTAISHSRRTGLTLAACSEWAADAIRVLSATPKLWDCRPRSSGRHRQQVHSEPPRT